MKPKLFQKIAEDMKSGIPIEVEIVYGAVSIGPDFLKLLNKEFGGGKGSFHTDDIGAKPCCRFFWNIGAKPCDCDMRNPLIIRPNNDEASTPIELNKMAEDFNYFSKKFPGVWWQSYVIIKDKKENELCGWNIGSSYEKLESSEVSTLFLDEPYCIFTDDDVSEYRTKNAQKTAIRNCPSHGKTCRYLRRISGELK